MYSPLQLALRYGKYRLSAHNGRGHGMHSPFVYALIRDVLNDREKYPAYRQVEQLRKQLLQNQEMLPVTDFGAGSVTGTHPQRSIASIARHAAKPRKYGQLLYRLVQYFTPAQLLELGTSLGITSSYLALGYEEGRLHTIEGAPAIAAIAQHNFEQLGLKNIQLHTGQFEVVLPALLQQLQRVDFAFLDGNHREEPTIDYFKSLLPFVHNDTVVVLDDIHWSAGMERAWNHISRHEAVTCSIDLFFIGLVFFRREFHEKAHFSIKY